MLQKYRITVTEIYTGKELMKPVECDGFLIQGYLGPRGEGGCYKEVSVRIHQASKADIGMGLHANDVTREAMMGGAKAAKKYDRIMFWRRLFGRGEKE